MSTESLATLGFHLDGRICRVGCSFCYLAARGGEADGERQLDPGLIGELVARAPAREIAVAVSEPARRWRAGLEALVAAAQARGLPVAVVTTAAVVTEDPWVLDGVSRLTLSIDPAKERRPGASDLDLDAIAAALRAVRRPDLEIIGMVSLATPQLAAELSAGRGRRLLQLIELPGMSAIALNGLKPPPPWCDRDFWLRFLARIAPVLDRHLQRRLHLDCYVGARILGLGACPAKPDISPGREFRACVYQARPDFVFSDADELVRRTAGYTPPAECPFPIV